MVDEMFQDLDASVGGPNIDAASLSIAEGGPVQPGDKHCTLLVRGKSGATLSKADRLRFPFGSSRQTLGPAISKAGYGWNVEIVATFSTGKASDWTIRNDIKDLSFGITLKGERTADTFDSGSETWPPYGYYQVSGTRVFAIDSPGFRETIDDDFIEARTTKNFTTTFSNGKESCVAEWSILIHVRRRRIIGADFKPYHLPLN